VAQFYDETCWMRIIVQIGPLHLMQGKATLATSNHFFQALKLRGSSTIWTGSCGNFAMKVPT